MQLPSALATQCTFGFHTIPEESKDALVQGMFDYVMLKYDVINDAMLLSVHHLWKDSFISLLCLGLRGPVCCINIAGGTGDIMLCILNYACETCVNIVDINTEMLKEGSKCFKKMMYHNSMCACPYAPHFFQADNGSFQHHRLLLLKQMPQNYP